MRAQSVWIALVMAGVASVANGQMVFNNPWDSTAIDAGGFSHFSQVLAGEFDLTAGAAVSDASWRGTMFSPDPLNTGDTWNFDVLFYNNNGGIPGSVFATRSVIADVADTNINISGERVYIFDVSFNPVNLAANTTYFFTALNTGSQGTFRWNMGTDTNYSGWFGTGGSWTNLGSRAPLNFSLSIPTPATASLLGLAGLSAIRRRR